jgi:hypothetical protein
MTPDAPVSRPRPMAGTMKPPRTRQIVRAQRNSGAGRGKRVAKSWVPRTTGLQFGGVTLSHQLAKLAGSFRAIVWRVRHPKGEMRWAFEYFRMWHVRHYREEPRARDGRGAGTYTVEASADVILTVTRCDRPDGTPRAAIKVEWIKDGEEGDCWSFELRWRSAKIEPASPSWAPMPSAPSNRQSARGIRKNLPLEANKCPPRPCRNTGFFRPRAVRLGEDPAQRQNWWFPRLRWAYTRPLKRSTQA